VPEIEPLIIASGRSSTCAWGLAIAAWLMSGVLIVALAYRLNSRVWHTASWASVSLMALQLLNAVVQFLHGQ
jgi:cation:H+ antiporter